MDCPRSLDEVHFSKHCLQRALDSDMQPDEIRAAVETPARCYTSAAYPETLCMQRDRVTVVVKAVRSEGKTHKPWVAVTMLWSTTDDWDNDYQRGGYENIGREKRW